MNGDIMITHGGVVDADGVGGTARARTNWRELDLDPVAERVRWGPIFATPFREFRRLDITSRMFVIAVECCGLPGSLTDQQREATAMVLGSSSGCLAADLRFEESLHVETGIEPAVFPYTLPSTVLGEIAIRHRLRGPTICLSVPGDGEHQALAAAVDLLAGGEAPAALVLLGDWLPPERAGRVGLEGKTHVVALLLQLGDPDTPHLATLDAVLSAPETVMHSLAQVLSPHH